MQNTNIENKEVKTSSIEQNETSNTNTTQQKYERPYTPKYYVRRKKFCKLCAKGIEHIDYKDVELLQKYLNHNMKIASRKITAACAAHQRRVSNAIKRARNVALIHCIKD